MANFANLAGSSRRQPFRTQYLLYTLIPHIQSNEHKYSIKISPCGTEQHFLFPLNYKYKEVQL
jgi:hypothetical protein